MSSTRHQPSTRRLDDGPLVLAEVGAKAARLSELNTAGHRVPPGLVITADTIQRGAEGISSCVDEILAEFGDRPLAVRSSAVAEDRYDASFAGLYETVLDVVGRDALAVAVATVVASASSPTVSAYGDSGGPIAVLVQPMLHPSAAGVAFSADPVTGDRNRVIIDAVAGVGEALVSGEVSGEHWVVDDTGAHGPDHGALSTDDASRIAALARTIHAGAGNPQDLEWAIADGELWLLQARPLTALVEHVDWDERCKGWWRRDFRLGEWLPQPVTPLFETWFLPVHEERFSSYCAEQVGITVKPPLNKVVNGWCFANTGRIDGEVVRMMLSHPRYLARAGRAMGQLMRGNPQPAAEAMGAPAVQRLRHDVLPRYRTVVSAAGADVEAASPERLVQIVDEITQCFGEYLMPVVEAVGLAYRCEFPLATLYRDNLADRLGGTHLTLLTGLVEPAALPDHAVTSLDWCHPTHGELASEMAAQQPDRELHGELVSRRTRAVAECRAALADQPKVLARFERCLAVVDEYAPIREELVRDMTLGWPVMRRALLRLGAVVASHGSVNAPDDVFWLTRAELDAALGGDRTDRRGNIAERREIWTRQCRLTPPTKIGRAKSVHERLGRKMVGATVVRRHDALVSGMPSSAGRATGRVSVVHGSDQFDTVQPGDILVCQVTTPAWTRLFGIVAAVVTDGGSVAAHASVIAREFGIPAVVGCVDATKRLRTGTLVTVDGTTGQVTPA